MASGKVTFGRLGALAGIIAGVLIAVGVSAVALLTPANIEGSARCILTVIALIAGGIVTLVSAFFGIVIPKEVEGDDDEDEEDDAEKPQAPAGEAAPKA